MLNHKMFWIEASLNTLISPEERTVVNRRKGSQYILGGHHFSCSWEKICV
jgi:hypothetical protein